MRTRKKSNVKTGFASNIPIKNKVTIIALIIIISLVVIAYTAYSILTAMINENKTDNERVIASAAQRYVENEIDSMVRISEAVYRNEDIYELVSTRYKTSVDYHEAFYDFDNNKFPATTAGSAVEQLIVYTANNTVMNGKYISRLSEVKTDDWYVTFKNTNRDVIIYCSKDDDQISLIRRLNYKNITTGEAILKLDFNASRIKESFVNLGFDGRIYAASGRMLICSNQKNSELPSTADLADYYSTYKNYYTCNIDFYVRANTKRPVSITAIPFAVPLLVVLVLGIAVIVIIIIDFKNRTLKVCGLFDDKLRVNTSLNKPVLGRDEIGKLHKIVNNSIFDLNRFSSDLKKQNTSHEEYKTKTNEVLLKALNYETKNKLGIDSLKQISEPVTLDEELLNMGRLLNDLKEREYFKYSLLADTKSTIKDILPYSFSAIALHVAQYNGTGAEMEINVRESENRFTIRYRKLTVPGASDMLKLRSEFEIDSTMDQPVYDPEDEFNPYIRLVRYYIDRVHKQKVEGISFKINSKTELDFEISVAQKANEEQK